MKKRIGLTVLGWLALIGAAWCADLTKAKRLLQIGDSAGALAELHGLAQAQPEHAEARLLIARAFAQCPFDLQMPGTVAVGRSNRERALYQLGILAKLGPAGQKLLLDSIAGGGKLAPLAMSAAGTEKLSAAVVPLGRVLDRKTLDAGTANTAISALVQIGGPRAAAVIKKMLDRETDKRRRRWLAARYLGCLAEKDLVKLAQTCQDGAVLQELAYRRSGVPDAAWVALARRRGLEPSQRRRALDRLSRMAEAQPAAYVGLLEELLKDPSDDVRWAATERLARAAPPKAIGPLVAALATRKRAGHALTALRNMKSQAVVAPMMKVLEQKCDLKKSRSWHVNRGQVYQVIVGSGADGEVLLRAVRLMLTPDPSQTGAYRPPHGRPRLHLPRLPSDKLARVVAALVKDTDPNVRHAAARALTDLEPKAALDSAFKLCRDKDAEVRRYAERAILHHARAGHVAPARLGALLNSDDGYVLRTTAQMLAVKPDKAVRNEMLALLKDGKRSPHAMGELARFFAALPDPRAADPLAAALLSERPPAPVDALATALKTCAKDLPAAARRVAGGLKHKSSLVRRNAITALGVLGDPSVLPDLVDAAGSVQSSAEKRLIKEAMRALTRKK